VPAKNLTNRDWIVLFLRSDFGAGFFSIAQRFLR